MTSQSGFITQDQVFSNVFVQQQSNAGTINVRQTPTQLNQIISSTIEVRDLVISGTLFLADGSSFVGSNNNNPTINDNLSLTSLVVNDFVQIGGNLTVGGTVGLSQLSWTGSPLSTGTLLVSDGALPQSSFVAFDPQTVGAVPGQVLQYTGTGNTGLSWATLSGGGICVDTHGLTVGNGTNGVCVRPEDYTAYASGAGQLVTFDGGLLQTDSKDPTPQGIQFGPAATGADALVTFDPTLLSGGMPKWTPTPTTHNAILYNDTTLVAGSRLTWTNSPSNPNTLLFVDPLNVPNWLASPTQTNALMYYDGSTLNWMGSGAGSNENLLVVKASSPSWLGNPSNDAVLVHQGGTTQWDTNIYLTGAGAGLAGSIPYWNGSGWSFANCAQGNVNAIMVSSGIGTYSCVDGPLNDNALLYYDAATGTLVWSATGVDENLMVVKSSAPSWLGNPSNDAVLVHQGNSTQWDTNIYLTGAGAGLAGSVPYWNGSGWSFANCAQGNVNAIMVSSGIGTYSCVDGPTVDNALLYYDAATSSLVWSAAGVNENIMVVKSSAPTWLSNPSNDAVLVHVSGSVGWMDAPLSNSILTYNVSTGTLGWTAGSGVNDGTSPGQLLVWDGSSWGVQTGASSLNEILRGTGSGTYASVSPPTLANGDAFNLMFFNAVSNALEWSSGSGTNENLLILRANQPHWLANPTQASNLTWNATTSSVEWVTRVPLSGGGVAGDMVVWDGTTWQPGPNASSPDQFILGNGSGTYKTLNPPTNPDHGNMMYFNVGSGVQWTNPATTGSVMVYNVTNGLPEWTSTVPTANSVLAFDFITSTISWKDESTVGSSLPNGGSTAGPLLVWDGASWVTGPNAATTAHTLLVGLGGGTYGTVDPPVVSTGTGGQIMFFDTLNQKLVWSGEAQQSSVLTFHNAQPTWVSAPTNGRESVLIYNSTQTQWSEPPISSNTVLYYNISTNKLEWKDASTLGGSGATVNSGTLDGDLLVWNAATTSWDTGPNASNTNEILVGLGGGAYGAITAPSSTGIGCNVMFLSQPANALQWSGEATTESVLWCKGGTVSWSGTPLQDSVLFYNTVLGTVDWKDSAAIGGLNPGNIAGDMMVWDGSSWVPGLNASNPNELLRGTGGGYAPIASPNTGGGNGGNILYYDTLSGTPELRWTNESTAGASVMTFQSGTPTWIASPGVTSVLEYDMGTNTIVWVDVTTLGGGGGGGGGSGLPSGTSPGELLVWDGTSWIAAVNASAQNSLLRGAGNGTYTEIIAPNVMSVGGNMLFLDTSAGGGGGGGGGGQVEMSWTNEASPGAVMTFQNTIPGWALPPIGEDSILVFSNMSGQTSWLPSPLSQDSVLFFSFASKTITWVDANSVGGGGGGGGGSSLPSGTSNGDLLVWDGTSWTANTNASAKNNLLVGSDGSYVAIPAPFLSQQGGNILYLDGTTGPGTESIMWSGEGTANSVMTLNGSNVPEWAAPPGTGSVFIYNSTNTQSQWIQSPSADSVLHYNLSTNNVEWLSDSALGGGGGGNVINGTTPGEMLVWDGASWVPGFDASTNLSLIIGAGSGNYSAITAPVAANQILASTSGPNIEWSAPGQDENVMVVKSNTVSWLPNPNNPGGVLVNEYAGAISTTKWVDVSGGTTQSPSFLGHDGSTFQWLYPLRNIVSGIEHQSTNISSNSGSPTSITWTLNTIGNSSGSNGSSFINTDTSSQTINFQCTKVGRYYFHAHIDLKKDSSTVLTNYTLQLFHTTSSGSPIQVEKESFVALPFGVLRGFLELHFYFDLTAIDINTKFRFQVYQDLGNDITTLPPGGGSVTVEFIR